MKAASGGGGESSTSSNSIHTKYPISSQWEFKLKNGDVVKGEVYCTDPVAQVVVIQDALKDIRMISLAGISESKQVGAASADAQEKLALTSPSNNLVHAKKALEEREKRAVRIAQDSLKHLNPKASTRGQTVFDLLLKACKDVSWKGESIIVLDSIQVDPPYAQENCKLLQEGSGKGSLDRVQKIVSSVGDA